MSSATTAVAVQYRLKEWAEQIRECQNRPAGMSVVDWCASHGITKANYYYRLRRVRQQWHTAGAFRFCKRFFHPHNGIHTHAAACGSP